MNIPKRKARASLYAFFEGSSLILSGDKKKEESSSPSRSPTISTTVEQSSANEGGGDPTSPRRTRNIRSMSVLSSTIAQSRPMGEQSGVTITTLESFLEEDRERGSSDAHAPVQTGDAGVHSHSPVEVKVAAPASPLPPPLPSRVDSLMK